MTKMPNKRQGWQQNAAKADLHIAFYCGQSYLDECQEEIAIAIKSHHRVLLIRKDIMPLNKLPIEFVALVEAEFVYHDQPDFKAVKMWVYRITGRQMHIFNAWGI